LHIFIIIALQTLLLCILLLPVRFPAFFHVLFPHFGAFFFISDFDDLLKNSENFVGGLKNPGKPGHNFPGCVVSLLSLLRTFCPQEWRALFSVSSHESLPSR